MNYLIFLEKLCSGCMPRGEFYFTNIYYYFFFLGGGEKVVVSKFMYKNWCLKKTVLPTPIKKVDFILLRYQKIYPINDDGGV